MLSARERSDHTGFVDGGFLYVWGGHHSVAGEQVFLPSDEIWVYDMSSGVWSICAMGGEVPPTLSQTCGCCLNGVMYIFGGSTEDSHTNQLYCVNLRDGMFAWRRVTESKGSPPSPRDKHSCWVYADRLIYFGGYGCKQTREVTRSRNFITDEMSWVTTGTTLFRFWGWNNEVHVFNLRTNTWTEPQTHGVPPKPRAAHSTATLGRMGYVCGGLESRLMDIHCLDLEMWTWTEIVPVSAVPVGRTWHTLTASSDSTLFLFGGVNMAGEPLSDGWRFDVQKKEWRELQHPHTDKPRLWHSACLGQDSDVIVFGGSRDYTLVMDTISVLLSPSQSHCSDVLVFQIQPLPLVRLCEDCVGRNARALEEYLSCLPKKIQENLRKRISFFKNDESQGTCHSR
ncbi:hypothetical protein COCON_G00032090 [Conger conger]|uniref:Kelch domain-containing protein 1 n=1 Tax=Conger conger TaxID=82655 RepID=A0A9Q1DZ31_CONCO|nr:kelch domain-containing protein 1-like [Conger conger]KAJ8284359.1 hypothetical protein COCON_G00032090 [Conger conger]